MPLEAPITHAIDMLFCPKRKDSPELHVELQKGRIKAKIHLWEVSTLLNIISLYRKHAVIATIFILFAIWILTFEMLHPLHAIPATLAALAVVFHASSHYTWQHWQQGKPDWLNPRIHSAACFACLGFMILTIWLGLYIK